MIKSGDYDIEHESIPTIGSDQQLDVHIEKESVLISIIVLFSVLVFFTTILIKINQYLFLLIIIVGVGIQFYHSIVLYIKAKGKDPLLSINNRGIFFNGKFFIWSDIEAIKMKKISTRFPSLTFFLTLKNGEIKEIDLPIRVLDATDETIAAYIAHFKRL